MLNDDELKLLRSFDSNAADRIKALQDEKKQVDENLRYIRSEKGRESARSHLSMSVKLAEIISEMCAVDEINDDTKRLIMKRAQRLDKESIEQIKKAIYY